MINFAIGVVSQALLKGNPIFPGEMTCIRSLGVLLTQLHVSAVQEAVTQYVLQRVASLSKLAFYAKQITSLS